MPSIRRAIDRTIRKYLDYLDSKRRQVISCNVRGRLVLVEADSPIEIYRAESYSSKEPETLEWIERYFKEGDVLYDIGANIGLYSLFAAKVLKGNCKVLSFEPEAMNYASLNRNIYINGLSGTITAYCAAVADRTAIDSFYLNAEDFSVAPGRALIAGTAMHAFGQTRDHHGEPFRPHHMQGMVGFTLDSLWQTWGLDFPTHIKIDVDGLEEKIVAGASATLHDPRLKSVLIEITERATDGDAIVRAFVDAGFTSVTDFSAHSKDSLVGTPYEGSVNYIFVRESR